MTHQNESSNESSLKFLALANIAGIYHLEADLENAEMFYRKALAIRPNSHLVKANLERLLNIKSWTVLNQRPPDGLDHPSAYATSLRSVGPWFPYFVFLFISIYYTVQFKTDRFRKNGCPDDFRSVSGEPCSTWHVVKTSLESKRDSESVNIAYESYDMLLLNFK